MKQIIAIVKPFRAQAVLEAIAEFHVDLVTVGAAKGFGRQKDLLPQYVGSEYSDVYLPKIEISLLVPAESVEAVLDRIVEVARTGRIGDGKMLVFDVVGEIDF